MKTSELAGAALDYWVAKAEGWIETRSAFNKYALWDTGGGFYRVTGPLGEYGDERWCPSTNWGHGGPIIEREAITIEKIGPALWAGTLETPEGKQVAYVQGSSALVAAMRAYVASKFGEEVVDNP